MNRHKQADVLVGLGRACGSVPWGRGSRRREREPVFPDHSSGLILQPDRLLQACSHPSLTLSHSPSHPLHPVLSLATIICLYLPPSRCFSCHSSSPHLHHSILRSSLCPVTTITSSLSPPSPKYFVTVCQAAQLHHHHFFVYISPTLPLISFIGSFLCPSDGPSHPLFPSIFPLWLSSTPTLQ